jgi:hypothetical protein
VSNGPRALARQPPRLRLLLASDARRCRAVAAVLAAACQAFVTAVDSTQRILEQVIAELPAERGAHAHRDTYVAAAKLDLAADK